MSKKRVMFAEDLKKLYNKRLVGIILGLLVSVIVVVYYVPVSEADDLTPPVITIVSPENRTYTTTTIDLKIAVNEDVDEAWYSLDSQENETILVINFTTLRGLWQGIHSIVVFANDTAGNIGRSETVCFTINVTAITVDGEITDWKILGLNSLGTDPPYNIESYHHISSDLLEGWAHMDSTNLYLAMKIRGGYSFDWDRVDYRIRLDTDLNESTGSPSGDEYLISDGHYGHGSLYKWDEEILSWDHIEILTADPGLKGYIEWKVPLSSIENPEKIRLTFYTYDLYLEEIVNSISGEDIVIPEFPSLIVLPSFMIKTLLAVIVCRRVKYSDKKSQLL